MQRVNQCTNQLVSVMIVIQDLCFKCYILYRGGIEKCFSLSIHNCPWAKTTVYSKRNAHLFRVNLYEIAEKVILINPFRPFHKKLPYSALFCRTMTLKRSFHNCMSMIDLKKSITCRCKKVGRFCYQNRNPTTCHGSRVDRFPIKSNILFEIKKKHAFNLHFQA